MRLVGEVQRRVALCAYGLSVDGGRELIDFLIVKTESQASTRDEAIATFRAWKTRWRSQAERAVRCVEEDLEELLAFYDSPHSHWKRLRTTNVIGRQLRTHPRTCLRDRGFWGFWEFKGIALCLINRGSEGNVYTISTYGSEVYV